MLYVTQYFSSTPIHASAITTYEIVRGLAERGHNVSVISPHTSGVLFLFKKNAGNIDVMRALPFPRFEEQWYDGFKTFLLHTVAYMPLFVSTLVANRRYGDFDIIISMHHPSHMASFCAYLLSRVFNLPLIIKTHDVYNFASGGLKGLYFRFLDNLHHIILKRARRVLVVSNYLKLKVTETHQLDKHHVLVFPNGVDVRRFKPGIASGSLRSDLSVGHRKIILFTGAITRDRGLDLLINALPEIVAKNPHVIVLIVGEGPQRPDLEKLAHDVGVERFLKFIPPVSNMEIPRYISMADITVGPLAERLETLGSVPRKVLEYMACAKPVVAVRGGVSKDLILDGYNGFLTGPSSVKELTAVILKLLDNHDLARDSGLKARKFMENFYDMDKLMDRFDGLLYEVCRRNR